MSQFLIDHHIILYPIIAFFGALISALSLNIIIARNISILFGIINFTISLIPDHFHKKQYSIGNWSEYIGINFHIWDKSWILIVLLNFIFLFVLIFDYKILEDFINKRYDKSKSHLIYSLLQLAQCGFLGIVVTQDFFTLYVFIEISSLSSYVLLSFGRDRKSLVSALDYLILGTIGATLILIAIGIILKITGHLNMIIAQQYINDSKAFQIAYILYIIGSLLKLAFFPIHSWMISAYKNTFSIILIYIGSISSTIAAYILYEFMYLFLKNQDWPFLYFLKDCLYYFSGIVVILFAYMALVENNLRKILLFSASIYSGYLVMIIMSGVGQNILIYYLVVAAAIKIGMFYTISVLEKNNINPDVESIIQIRSSRIFSIVYIILVLSNSGLPITAGFIAKILLLKELSSIKYFYGIITILISSAIALLYNYKILIPLLKKSQNSDPLKINLTILEKVGLCIVGALQLLIIFLPNYINEATISHIFTFYINAKYIVLFLYGVVLFAIILLGSFIRKSFLRLSILIGSSILYTIMISILTYNYFHYNLLTLNIFEYKIANFKVLSFSIDQYSMVYLLLLSILWPISILYSDSYLKNLQLENNINKSNSRFLFFINLCIVSSSFIAISGDLITMFSFYEILSLSTIPLIIYNQTEQSYKALYKYFKLLFIPSTLFFLLGIFLVYSHTHDVSFLNNTGVLRYSKITDPEVILLILIFIIGISKLATLPFYGWLPAAMVAIHPVSAILHGVAVVNSGIFCLVKIVIYIFGIDLLGLTSNSEYLLLIPTITIIISSILALYQDSIKKILAYSTIAQINIMLASLLSFTKIGIINLFAHMIIHSFAKLLLFFKAGDIYIATKSDKLSDLGSVAKKMPFTYIAMILGGFSLTGIFLFPSYYTKKQIINSLMYNTYTNIYAIYIILLSGLFTIGYFIKIIYSMAQQNRIQTKLYPVSKAQFLASSVICLLLLATSFLFYKHYGIGEFNFLILIIDVIIILSYIFLYKKNYRYTRLIKVKKFQTYYIWVSLFLGLVIGLYICFVELNIENLYQNVFFFATITLIEFLIALESLVYKKISNQKISMLDKNPVLLLGGGAFRGRDLFRVMQGYFIWKKLFRVLSKLLLLLNRKIMIISNPKNLNFSLYGVLGLFIVISINVLLQN